MILKYNKNKILHEKVFLDHLKPLLLFYRMLQMQKNQLVIKVNHSVENCIDELENNFLIWYILSN